ncbi:LADA_0E06348g1_1 [Lachancea dasiensis]|uniref:LADA_0E06348g1_1 n=1 Tax=Lachancea dasiensis TaxID=1072105 RepID=A0A1G4JCI0_9SACH|nr:LADA_0E06348g1_1 [Lachancea dasiensis]
MSATDTYPNNPRVTAPGGATEIPGMTTAAPHDENAAWGRRHEDVEENKSGKRKLLKAGIVATDFLLISLRFLQFVASVIVLGLLAYVLKGYEYHGSRKTNYGLAVACISTFYLLMLCILAPVLHRFLMPGLYLILEAIMTILWLVAFIVLAKAHGSRTCGLSSTNTYNSQYGSFSDFVNAGGSYDPYTGRYTSNAHMRACRSSQAAIAFSGMATILFIVSPILIGLLVIKPLLARSGGRSSSLWQPYKNAGLKLNPHTGLRVSDAERSDTEALGHAAGVTGAGHDQHTFSTGDSTYNGVHNDKLADSDHRRNVSGATEMDPHATNTNPTTADATSPSTDPNVMNNTTYSGNQPIVTDTSVNPRTDGNPNISTGHPI